MTTKSYLGQINRLEKMIQNKLSEIYRLKTMAVSVTISNSGDKVQVSADKDRLGNTVAKIIDAEKETDNLVDSLIDKREKIIGQIEKMENTDYYNVLHMRYVGLNTFDNISKATGWSMRQIFKIHGRALQEFENMYGEEYL